MSSKFDQLLASLENAVESDETNLIIKYARQVQAESKNKIGLLGDYMYACHCEAVSCVNASDWQAAEAKYRELMELYLQTRGRHDISTATVTWNYADVLMRQEKYEDALPLLSAAKNTCSEISDIELHAKVSADLGECFDKLGDFVRALQCYEIAYYLYLSAFGAEERRTVMQQFNMGEIFRVVKDFPTSERWIRRAVDLERRARGESQLLAHYLNNLGEVYQALNQLDLADEHIVHSLEMRERIFGRKSDPYLRSLHSLIRSEMMRRDGVRVEELFKALDEASGLLSGGQIATPDRFQHYIQEGFAEAMIDPLLEYVNSIEKSEKTKLTILELYFTLFIAATKLEKWDDAYDYMKKVIQLNNEMLFDVFKYGSRSGIGWLMQYCRKNLDTLLAMVSQSSMSNERVREAYQHLRFYRGLETRIHQLQKDCLLNSGLENDGNFQRIILERNSLQIELTKELLKSSPSPTTIDVIRDALETRDREALASFDSGALANLLMLTSSLESTPKPRSACIEFTKVFNELHNYPSQSDTSYAAFLFMPDGSLMFRRCEDSSSIDHAIKRMRNALSEPDEVGIISEQRWFNSGKFLYNKLIDPFMDDLSEVDQLYFVTDGDLNGIPFEVLPISDELLMIDRFDISYVWHSGEVAQPNFVFGRMPQPSESLVMAAPKFQRQEEGGSVPASCVFFPDLKHASVEGHKIAAQLGVEPLIGEKATKEILTKSASPYILHLATHSFFLPRDTAATGYAAFNERRALADPLERCGIALSGAEDDVKVCSARSDGIVFGAEVVDFDWRSTELVAISACQSAVGDVQHGDGMHGLRRSFRAAGCKRVLSALWLVPDEATTELMLEFYHRIEAGLDAAKALREAKIIVRKKFGEHPFYWGAFILDGSTKNFPLKPERQLKFVSFSASDCEALLQNSKRRLDNAAKKMEEGDLDGAMGALDWILQSEGASSESRAEALLLRSRIHATTDRLKEALSDCDVALDFKDISKELVRTIRRERSLLKIRLNDLQGACIDLNFVLEQSKIDDDERAWLLVNRSFVLQNLGELNLALTDCDAVLRLKNVPTDQKMRALLNRSQLNSDLRLMDNAIEDATRALSLCDKHDAEARIQVLFARSKTYLEAEKLDLCFKDIRECIRILNVGNSPSIKQALSKVERLIKQRKTDDAKGLLTQILMSIYRTISS